MRKRDRTSSSVKGARQAARRIAKVDDLFGDGYTGNLLQGEYDKPKVHAWFQNRHKGQYAALIDEAGYYRHNGHEWKVPFGVRLCLKQRIGRQQVVNKHPWYVTWVSPKTGKRLKKYFSTAAGGIEFIAEKAQYVDPKAALISKSFHYDIPAKLRGKIPTPFKWCPRCMTARRFRAVAPEETFFALRKEWNESKSRYEFMDRRLRLLKCSVCGCTNRDPKMRRSNQPWEIRKFKSTVRRAKRRR